MTAIALITHPECRLHEMGTGHPERPERLAALAERLRESDLAPHLQPLEAPEADVAALTAVHDAAHVEAILRAQPARGLVRIDPDTAMNPHSASAALRAAGAAVLGVDTVLAGAARVAFCAVRPPGHHAERARAMGFCLFNNVAVAAAHALRRGLARVAVLDFDVHYGNGTADIFGHDPRVQVCNTYQHPLYPYWEGDPDATSLVDAPLPAGSGGAAFRQAVTSRWLPALERFAPELVLVSAGFDAHARDPLAGLEFQDQDFGWIGETIRDVADRYAQGRVVATLEGGYDLDGLSGGVESFLRAFVPA